MKRLLFSALIVLMATTVYAAEKTVEWDTVDGAAGYKITISIDSGATWAEVADVTAPAATATITIPDHGLVLIRASSYNNIGEATNTISGVWMNEDWNITAIPKALRTPGD